MIDLSDYDYAVLDCDGVILDSNWLKTDAIIRTLEDEPEKCIDKMIAYHKANGGISRYKKFRHYFEEINPYEDVEIKAKVSISKFAEIVQKGLLECDYIPGVVDFINNVKDGNFYRILHLIIITMNRITSYNNKITSRFFKLLYAFN